MIIGICDYHMVIQQAILEFCEFNKILKKFCHQKLLQLMKTFKNELKNYDDLEEIIKTFEPYSVKTELEEESIEDGVE